MVKKIRTLYGSTYCFKAVDYYKGFLIVIVCSYFNSLFKLSKDLYNK